MSVYLGTNGVDMRGGLPMREANLQDKTKSYTPTETAQSETITADVGYDGLDEVSISVGAISSTYVGSAIPQRDSDDLTVSGATVSVPSGYYENNASKSVASGTEGTPTATKGTVSSHSISVTPSVTNTAGYISGGTKTGTAVSVSASELVSGTLSVTSSGTYNVTNYASASVPSGTEGTPTATKGVVYNHQISVTPKVTNTEGYIAGSTMSGTAVTVKATELVSGTLAISNSGTHNVTNYESASVQAGTEGTPTATKGTVSNHSVSITPSVTNTTGYITGSTKTGTAVTVSASELVSGSQTVTSNQTVDVTNLAELVVNVSGGGSSKNAQVVQGTTRTTSSTLTAIGAEMTVSKTGTYDVYWSAFRSSTSASYTYGTQLYVGGTAYGTQNTTWSNHVQNNHLSNVSLTANEKIRVYGRNSRGSSYYIYAPTLVIIEA